MKLEDIVPWGRNRSEYMEMFALESEDLSKRKILGCADGPSSFNAEVHHEGGSVVSIDPLYGFDKKEIAQRIDEVRDEVMMQIKANTENFVWKSIPDADTLEYLRVEAMTKFLTDYEEGKREGRYIDASLPNLPFDDHAFDLALSSHFLFLYSGHLNEDFHVGSIIEMLRVSDEVRIFPLLTLENVYSPYLETVKKALEEKGYTIRILRSEYEFQKGASEMMSITRR